MRTTGSQTYANGATFAANARLAASDFAFGSGIDGANYILTLDKSGDAFALTHASPLRNLSTLFIAGDASVNGLPSTVTSFRIGGTTTLRDDVQSAGRQQYDGPVVLETARVALTVTGANSEIRFNSTIAGKNGTEFLVIQQGIGVQ